MSNPRSMKFSSLELQKAVAEAASALEERDQVRNQISNDIKELEGYLEGLKLTEPFRLALGKSLYSDLPDREVALSLEFTGGAGGKIREEALAWSADPKGRFRLMYEITEWDGGIDVDLPGGPYYWDDATETRESRPLIETKLETRTQMHESLPRFVRELAAKYSRPAPFVVEPLA
jgi:hypothetical protein